MSDVQKLAYCTTVCWLSFVSLEIYKTKIQFMMLCHLTSTWSLPAQDPRPLETRFPWRRKTPAWHSSSTMTSGFSMNRTIYDLMMFSAATGKGTWLECGGCDLRGWQWLHIWVECEECNIQIKWKRNAKWKKGKGYSLLVLFFFLIEKEILLVKKIMYKRG